MENETKNNALPQTTMSNGQAHSEKPADQKNISLVPFRDQNPKGANCQPCMSLLYAISDAELYRGEVPGKDNKTPAVDQMLAEDTERKLIADAWRGMELEATNLLQCIKKYDPRVDLDGAKTLCDAISALDRALGVSS